MPVSEEILREVRKKICSDETNCGLVSRLRKHGLRVSESGEWADDGSGREKGLHVVRQIEANLQHDDDVPRVQSALTHALGKLFPESPPPAAPPRTVVQRVLSWAL